jgi:uncharacterized protein (DUF433 family)
MAVTLLDRTVTTVNEAARQLRIPPATLRHWLEGGERNGTRYEPVLRERSRGSVRVAWGEMVEARYLRAYRERVPMQRLRPFIAALRQEFGVAYPLAHLRPFVDANRRLVLALQERLDLPDELWLVFPGRAGQLRINPAIIQDFLYRVEFASHADAPSGSDEALRIYPMSKDAPVVIDPRVSSGAATVGGIRTAVLAERAEGFGETPEDLAEEFGLTPAQVKAAIAFEFAA